MNAPCRNGARCGGPRHSHYKDSAPSVCREDIVAKNSILHPRDGRATEVDVVGTGRIHILGIEVPFPSVSESILKEERHLVGMVVHSLLEIPRTGLTVHDIIIGEVPAIGDIGIAAELKALELAHRSVSIIYKRSLVVEVTGILAVAVFVKERNLSASVIESMGDAGMKDLSTVGKVGVALFLRPWSKF